MYDVVVTALLLPRKYPERRSGGWTGGQDSGGVLSGVASLESDTTSGPWEPMRYSV